MIIQKYRYDSKNIVIIEKYCDNKGESSSIIIEGTKAFFFFSYEKISQPQKAQNIK